MKKTATAQLRSIVEAIGQTVGPEEIRKLGRQAHQIIHPVKNERKQKLPPANAAPERLWLCVETTQQESVFHSVVASTEEMALARFRQMDGVHGWGTYEATEVSIVDGYRVVLQPLQSAQPIKKKQPRP